MICAIAKGGSQCLFALSMSSSINNDFLIPFGCDVLCQYSFMDVAQRGENDEAADKHNYFRLQFFASFQLTSSLQNSTREDCKCGIIIRVCLCTRLIAGIS